VAAIWVAVLLHLLAVGAKLGGGAGRPDFSHYYAAALAARKGLDPYTIDLKRFAAARSLDVGRTVSATGTPSFILCFEPLTLLSPQAAYRAWTGINFFLLVAALVTLIGAERGLGWRSRSAMAALALLYPPLEVHFQYAQSQIVVLALLVLMLRALERGRDATAGLALALAGLLRGFPLIMAGCLVTLKRWRALGYAMGAFAIGAFATAIAFGLARAVGFTRAIKLITSAQFVAVPANVALGSFVSRLCWYGWAVGFGEGFLTLRLPAAILAEIGLLALTVRATLRSHHCGGGGVGVGRAVALWISAAILLAPTAWLHYMVLLLVPFALIAAAAARGENVSHAAPVAVASYLTIAGAMAAVSVLPDGTSAWLRLGLEELGSVSMLAAYAAGYWFAVDGWRGDTPPVGAT